MCTVAKHKHIRAHPSHCEVWDGFFCICLPLLVYAGPQVYQRISEGSSQLYLTFLTLWSFFRPILASIHVFIMIHSCVSAFVCRWEFMCSGPNCLWILFTRNAAIPLLVLLKQYSSNSVDVHPIKMLFHHNGLYLSLFQLPKNIFIL